MNIIYLECKFLDITKRGFDFIGMSVFNQFLIDNIWFVTFVSQIEGCGGLICRRRGLRCPLGCQNRRSGHGERRRAAVPSASSFVLFKWLWGPILFKSGTVPISPFNQQSNVVTSISSSLLVQIWYFFLFFSKITIYSLISLFSVHSVCWVMFICLILFFESTTYK
jgi:hypothetical protein